MIRTVALGVACLAGLGAIAAAAKKPPPPQPAEVIFPVVAGNKADRLQLVIGRDTPADVEKVDVVYVPPDEDLIPSNQSPLQKAANPPAPRIASRHCRQKPRNRRSDVLKVRHGGGRQSPADSSRCHLSVSAG